MINTLMLFAIQRGVLQATIQLGEVLAVRSINVHIPTLSLIPSSQYALKPENVYFLPFHVIVTRGECTHHYSVQTT